MQDAVRQGSVGDQMFTNYASTYLTTDKKFALRLYKTLVSIIFNILQEDGASPTNRWSNNDNLLE